MRKNFSLLFLVVFTVALVFSCKKDDSDDVKPQLTCTLAKAFYFDSVGTISDSIVYTYTGAYITKLSNAAGFATLEYTSDKVTRRNFFSAGSSTADAYDVIAYNSDGTISSIKSYVIFGTTIQYAQYDFTYNGGKLSKLDLKEVDFNSGLLKPSSSSTFTYSGENISESVTTYYDDTGAVDDVATLTYAFDTNANYFRENNAIFTDYLFVDALDGTIVPLLLSANNVTKVTDGTDETALVYTLDSNQNFYEFLFGGAKYARYIYDCK